MTFKNDLLERTYNELLETATTFIKNMPCAVVDFLVNKGGIALYDSVWRDSTYQRCGFVNHYLYSAFSDDELNEQLALYKEWNEWSDKIHYHLHYDCPTSYFRDLLELPRKFEEKLRETYAPILALRTSAGYQCFNQLKRQDVMWNEAYKEANVIANAMFTFLCRKAWDEAYSKA